MKHTPHIVVKSRTIVFRSSKRVSLFHRTQSPFVLQQTIEWYQNRQKQHIMDEGGECSTYFSSLNMKKYCNLVENGQILKPNLLYILPIMAFNWPFFQNPNKKGEILVLSEFHVGCKTSLI